MKIDLQAVEDAAKELYIRALKVLPPDIKSGFGRLTATETGATAKRILATMVTNIEVAEATGNLLCQDTGMPIYNVMIGRGVEVDGTDLKAALRRGCERATREHPLRSSVVHPLTRKNEQSSCGRLVPVIHIDFSDSVDRLEIEMIPKGSGSENNSFLKMAIPAEGIDAIKTFVIDCVLAAGGFESNREWLREAWGRNDADGAALERQLSAAVNELGVGPQGLGGDSTSFAVHIELAATHITMNPIAVNMQCHSARRARASFTPAGVEYGF